MSATRGVSRKWMYIVVFLVAVLLTIVVAYLLMNISGRKQEAALYPLKVVEIASDELDPAVWARTSPSTTTPSSGRRRITVRRPTAVPSPTAS